MAIYGYDRYGAPTTYGGATFAASGFDLSPITIKEQGYGDVTLSWTTPDSTTSWSRIRLVRNQTGYPVDETDGFNAREILPASPSATHTDLNLTQGVHYYYGFFVETDLPTYSSTLTYNKGQVAKSVGGTSYVSIVDGNVGIAQTNTAYWAPINIAKRWVLAGQAVILTTTRYDHTSRLYTEIPPYYREGELDWSEPAEADKTTLAMASYPDVAKFLAIFGWALDGIQTKYENISKIQNPAWTPAWYLEALTNHVGLTIEATTSSKWQRVRLKNAAALARSRGTKVGLQNDITASLGYDAVATVGVNKMISWDTADAHFPEIDYWDAATTYAVGEFVRFGGAGIIYRNIAVSRGTAQAPPNGGSNTWWTPAGWNALPATQSLNPRYLSKAGWVTGDGPSSLAVLTGAGDLTGALTGNCVELTNTTGSTEANQYVFMPVSFAVQVWAVGYQFAKGNLVSYNSKTWEAQVDTIGITPGTDPLTWRLFLPYVAGGTDPQAIYENLIPVTGGTQYTASAYVTTVTGLAGASADIYIEWWSATGADLGNSGIGTASAITGGWTRRTITGTAPANARYAQIIIRSTNVVAGGKWVFRYVQFEAAAAASAYVPPRRVEVLVKPDRINHAQNPSMESATGTIVLRQNLMPNPLAGVNATSWNAIGGTGGTATISRQTGQTGWHNGATTSARATWTVASSAVSGGLFTDKMPVTAGKTYSSLIQVRCNKAQRVGFRLDWYTAGNVYISSSGGTVTVLGANVVTPVGLQAAVAPANATQGQIVVEAAVGTSGVNWAVSDWLEGSSCILEETDMQLNYGGAQTYGPSQTFFTGSYGAGDYGHPAEFSYGWAGAVNNSVSYMLAPSLDLYNGSASTDAQSSRSTEVTPLFGTYVQRLRWPSGAANTLGDGQGVTGLTVGQQYTYSRYIYVPTGSPDVTLSIDSIGTPSTDVTAKNTWVRISMTFIATSTTHVIRILLRGAATKGDDRVYSDGVLFEVGGQVGVYFDGSFGLSTEYFWAGAAHLSKSYWYQGYGQRRYRLNDIIKRSIPHGVPFTTRYADV